ncbi:MAG: HD domain-containing protein [Candidatus Levybacteria bacterium]|nr:HD domain-containing protein [Candidatus Levybacteria bacterium]
MQELYKQVEALFEKYHYPAHDFKHVQRTSNLAKQIAKSEGYDVLEAEIAGLLHDVGRTVIDPKVPHAKVGVPIARGLLDTYTNFSPEAKDRILEAISVHSDLHTEGKLNNIVQDADKLDGMGALGINRAYISQGNLPDYDPDNIFPGPGNYHNLQTVHDLITLEISWYSMLYTDKAREIGKPRYEFMITFMEEIKREVEESS